MSDYKVGWGKPPVASRFKKGNKFWRNREAKRKAPQNFSLGHDVTTVLGSVVSVVRDGKERKETRLQGIVDKLVGEALQGSVTAANDLLSFRLDAETLGKLHDTVIIFNVPGDENP